MTRGEELRPILIRGARLIDPGRATDFTGDILLENGRIAAVAPAIESGPDGCIVVNATGAGGLPWGLSTSMPICGSRAMNTRRL